MSHPEELSRRQSEYAKNTDGRCGKPWLVRPSGRHDLQVSAIRMSWEPHMITTTASEKVASFFATVGFEGQLPTNSDLVIDWFDQWTNQASSAVYPTVCQCLVEPAAAA